MLEKYYIASLGWYYKPSEVDPELQRLEADLTQKKIDLKLALDLLEGERAENARLRELLQQHQSYETKQVEK